MNQKRQSYQQGHERKKRIKEIVIYNKEKDRVDNEVKDKMDQIEILRKEIEQLINDGQAIEEKKQHSLCIIYNDSSLIQEMIEFGEQTTFSRATLKEIKEQFSKGTNVDDIQDGNIDSLHELDKTIMEQVPTEQFIHSLLSNAGDRIQLNEEDEDDANN